MQKREKSNQQAWMTKRSALAIFHRHPKVTAADNGFVSPSTIELLQIVMHSYRQKLKGARDFTISHLQILGQ